MVTLYDAKEILELVAEEWSISPLLLGTEATTFNQDFATGIGDWVATFMSIVHETEYYGTDPISDPDLGEETANPEGSGLSGARVEADIEAEKNVLMSDAGTWDNLTFYYGMAKYTLPSPLSVDVVKTMTINVRGSRVGLKLYFDDDTTALLSFDGGTGGVCGDTPVFAEREVVLTSYTGKSITAMAIWSHYTAVVAVESIKATMLSGELYLALDEYVPVHPKYQIVFMNKPQRNIFITAGVSKREQVITMELHVKPSYYKPSVIDTARDTFLAIKEEVERIFEEFRFDTVGSVINMSGWVDGKLPHGFANTKDPLELVSRFTIEVSYYQSTGGAVIGNRVKSVSVLDESLLGLLSAEWNDKDRWVEIVIPKGPILNQQLIGSQFYITIMCHDWASISKCFYETPIVEYSNYYPCNSDGSRTKFSVAGDEFSITLGDMEGSSLVFDFTDVRVQNIYLEKATISGLQESVWTIKLRARLCSFETQEL